MAAGGGCRPARGLPCAPLIATFQIVGERRVGLVDAAAKAVSALGLAVDRVSKGLSAIFGKASLPRGIGDVLIGTPSTGPIAAAKGKPEGLAFVGDRKTQEGAMPSPAVFAHGFSMNINATWMRPKDVGGDVSDGGAQLRAALTGLTQDTPAGKVCCGAVSRHFGACGFDRHQRGDSGRRWPRCNGPQTCQKYQGFRCDNRENSGRLWPHQVGF